MDKVTNFKRQNLWQIVTMCNILFLFFLFISASESKTESEIDHLCMAADDITWECNFIPKEIPVGFPRVRIVNVVKNNQDMPCDESSFSTKDNIVEYVEIVDELEDEANIGFENNCFTNLKHLKEIHIHSEREFLLSSDVFVGLRNVETLDISRCVRLPMDTLFRALNGTNKLPNLKYLILSSTGTVLGPYKMDKTNIDILARNITYLKMSKMQLSHLNLTAVILSLHNLKTLDLSFSNIFDIITDGLTKDGLKTLKVLDFSFATLPMKWLDLSGTFKFRNVVVIPDKNNAEDIRTAFTAETVNFTGVLNTETMSIWLYNCTLYTDNYEWSTKHWIAQQNNFKRFDVEFKCNNSNMQSLITFDLSNNGMEYIHPSIFYCMVNLEDIRLAHNHLFKMINENVTMFESLFRLSQNLKYIDLTDNDITFIPYETFGQNPQLEKINMSNNRLEQCHLDLGTLKHLRLLDLSNNRIKILDTSSLNNLKAIFVGNNRNMSDLEGPRVVLSSNPFSCSTCDSREFIRWLTTTFLINIESQAMKCINKNGKEEDITQATLDDVHNICDRTLIIIVTSGSCGLLLLLIAVLIKIIFLHRKKRRNDHKRAQVIAKIQRGFGPFEFLVMLSYSAEDKEFATEYIKIPLNNVFKEIFGVDRDLILTGDEHFSLGFMVHNEISLSLERVSVVLLLVSENFCSSTYCITELDQACMLKKPIILMFKEKVDENLMTPMLRTLYKTQTRILWTRESGEYRLTTNWGNVCSSIVDLILAKE